MSDFIKWVRRIFELTTQSENSEYDKMKVSDLISENQETSEIGQELVNEICNGATSISVFPSTQEANAMAQAHINIAYTSDSINEVKLYLLKSKVLQELRQFLLINTGTTESLCKMYDEFKKGLSDNLSNALPKRETAAITPLSAYHNYSLPGMNLLPGDHLKPYRDAIGNGEYELIHVDVNESVSEVFAKWKEEKETMKKKLNNSEALFSEVLMNAEAEAIKIKCGDRDHSKKRGVTEKPNE